MIGIKIENGLVVDAAMFDKLRKGWIEAPEDVGIGWVDNGDGTFSAPVQTPEALANKERSWRNSELCRADIEVFKAEDVTGAFNAENWREYRQKLRTWPDSPDFPDPSKRPTAPA